MNGISKVAGCRPPWDSKSSSDIYVCSTFNDISSYISHEHQIRNYEQELIIQKTGCLKPECRQGSLILGKVFIGTNFNFLVPVSTIIF